MRMSGIGLVVILSILTGLLVAPTYSAMPSSGGGGGSYREEAYGKAWGDNIYGVHMYSLTVKGVFRYTGTEIVSYSEKPDVTAWANVGAHPFATKGDVKVVDGDWEIEFWGTSRYGIGIGDWSMETGSLYVRLYCYGDGTWYPEGGAGYIGDER